LQLAQWQSALSVGSPSTAMLQAPQQQRALWLIAARPEALARAKPFA